MKEKTKSKFINQHGTNDYAPLLVMLFIRQINYVINNVINNGINTLLFPSSPHHFIISSPHYLITLSLHHFITSSQPFHSSGIVPDKFFPAFFTCIFTRHLLLERVTYCCCQSIGCIQTPGYFIYFQDIFKKVGNLFF